MGLSATTEDVLLDRVRDLVQAGDAVGRHTVAKELAVSPWQARKLLEQVRAEVAS